VGERLTGRGQGPSAALDTVEQVAAAALLAACAGLQVPVTSRTVRYLAGEHECAVPLRGSCARASPARLLAAFAQGGDQRARPVGGEHHHVHVRRGDKEAAAPS
jgi:hypothetical protein